MANTSAIRYYTYHQPTYHLLATKKQLKTKAMQKILSL